MTVRSEIERLTAEGLVYRLQGRGTFVSEPRVAQAGALSSFTEDMVARGLSPGSAVLSAEPAEADGFLAAALELAPGDPVFRLDRVRTADGDPVAIEQAFLPLQRYPGIEDVDFTAASLFDVLAGQFGVTLRDARQRAVAAAIDPDEAVLLDVPEGAPGLRFHTVAFDGDGVPAYYAASLYRGDRYEIEMRQTRTDGGDEGARRPHGGGHGGAARGAAATVRAARGGAAALRGAEPIGIVIVARGSSDYAAIFGRYLLEAATGRRWPCRPQPPDPLRGGAAGRGLACARDQPVRPHAGDRDSARALRARGARTVAVTNDPASPLAAAPTWARARRGRGGRGTGHQDVHGPAGRDGVVAEALGDVPWGDDDWELLPGSWTRCSRTRPRPSARRRRWATRASSWRSGAAY